MAERNTRPSWWRTGNPSSRLVCLGMVLGAFGGAIHLLFSTLPKFNPAFTVYYVVYLVIEVLVMALIGLLVAGAVILASSLVGETATRERRALVTGIVSFICSSILAFSFFSILASAASSIAGALTGLLMGGMFALVSYRHTSETSAA